MSTRESKWKKENQDKDRKEKQTTDNKSIKSLYTTYPLL